MASASLVDVARCDPSVRTNALGMEEPIRNRITTTRKNKQLARFQHSVRLTILNSGYWKLHRTLIRAER